MTDGLLTIRQCADKLGISEAQLRKMARSCRLPAEKHAGRWLVQAAALEKVTPIRRGVRRVRGRIAEGTSLDDLTHRLLGRGTVVSDPRRPGKRSAAALAEAAATTRLICRSVSKARPAPPRVRPSSTWKSAWTSRTSPSAPCSLGLSF